MQSSGHHEHTEGRGAHLMRVAIKHNKRQSGFISAHQHARGREVRLVRELVRSPGRGQSCAISDETHRLDERLVRELVQSPAERRVRQHQRPALEELGETHLDGELIGDAGARLRALAALEGLRVDRRRLIWEAIRGHQRRFVIGHQRPSEAIKYSSVVTKRQSRVISSPHTLIAGQSRADAAHVSGGAAVSSHVANLMREAIGGTQVVIRRHNPTAARRSRATWQT